MKRALPLLRLIVAASTLSCQGQTAPPPVFSPDATSRDLAMAYYKALLGGNLAVAPKGWELRKQNQEQLADDKKALDAWAFSPRNTASSRTPPASFVAS